MKSITKYQWDAQEYEKHSKGQQKWARELIEKLHIRVNYFKKGVKLKPRN